MTTSISTFLEAMGVTIAEATTIGEIDDLSLRISNPDKNSDGEIDALQNIGDIRLDIHVRAKADCTTSCGTGTLPLDNFDGTYISDVAGFELNPDLTSIYAVYTSSFDGTPASQWVQTSGVSTSLSNGATYIVSAMPQHANPDIDAFSTFSSSPFDSYQQWGADYMLSTAGVELPGYDKPVKIKYEFNGKRLEFPYFRSRAKDGFFNLIPDLKFNTDNNNIQSVDFRWMKWSGTAWQLATATEVGLLVMDESVLFKLYTAKAGSTEEGVDIKIPTASASGQIIWNATNVNKSSGVEKAIDQLMLIDFCSGVASYDDSLGLRIFAHSFGPATGGPAICP